jgi:hypothetical protein
MQSSEGFTVAYVEVAPFCDQPGWVAVCHEENLVYRGGSIDEAIRGMTALLEESADAE